MKINLKEKTPSRWSQINTTGHGTWYNFPLTCVLFVQLTNESLFLLLIVNKLLFFIHFVNVDQFGIRLGKRFQLLIDGVWFGFVLLFLSIPSFVG